jgi:hypothetical protein
LAADIVSRVVNMSQRKGGSAYVFDSLHNVHLVFHLLIQDAVLHELALVEFFRGVRVAGEL